MNSDPHIALEARLKPCRNILTLGVKPNFSDYSAQDAQLIRSADKIYYPTLFYADLFDAMGKKTFPSYHTYKYAQDKIKQTAMFNLMNIPHPRTKVFYGKRSQAGITDEFRFPFIAKIARKSAMGRGVFFIQNLEELAAYCQKTSPAYIQEYLPIDRDMRIVIIGKKVVHAYWRIAKSGEFRTNVAVGASISFDSVPDDAIDLALETAMKCQWDDVGVDICTHDNRYFVLEANMKYGKEGFRKAGIDYYRLMEKLIDNGDI